MSVITEADKKMVRSVFRIAEFARRGWTLSPFKPERLQEIDVPFELLDESLSVYDPRAKALAPAWVVGIWANLDVPIEGLDTRWDRVKHLLVVTRDDRREQGMVSAELTLNGRVSRVVRVAAHNYSASLQRASRRVYESEAED